MRPSVEHVERVVRLRHLADEVRAQMPEQGRQLEAIVVADARDLGPLAKSRVAEQLGVSAETIDEWLGCGVLRAAEERGGEFTRVDPTSFLEAEAKLSRLRAQGISPRLVLRVMRGPSSSATSGASVEADPGDDWFARLAQRKSAEGEPSA